MSKQTYYIIQTTPTMFVHQRSVFGGEDEAIGADKAKRYYSVSEACRAWRRYCAVATDDVPRRFPRILKVTTETKTIATRR